MYGRFREPWLSCCATVVNNYSNATELRNLFIFFQAVSSLVRHGVFLQFPAMLFNAVSRSSHKALGNQG